MVVTALLGIGATELVVILVIFLALFGVERIPAIAKTIGRMQGEWTRTFNEVKRQVRTEEERETDSRLALERARDRHVKAASPAEMELLRLRNAAEALGIDTQGKSAGELRAAIAAAASETPP